jgi:hypothetical protein
MAYWRKYVSRFIQGPVSLVCARAAPAKLSDLEAPHPVPCRVNLADATLAIDSGRTVVPLAIESVARCHIRTGAGRLEYVMLCVRGDPRPVVFYTANADALELWFDGLRLVADQRPETRASLALIDALAKAIDEAKLATLAPREIEIPPLPPPLNSPAH